MSKHKHGWKVVGWGQREPQSDDDVDHYWLFGVTLQCACGKEKTREATGSEVRERIEARKCTGCGLLNRKHESQSDCIRELFVRVSSLEAKLERIGNAF